MGIAMGNIRFLAYASALALAGCGATTPRPDLTVNTLSASPAEATSGTAITITSAMRNSGDAATTEPAAMDIGVYGAVKSAPLTSLTSWRQPDGASLAPGENVQDVDQVNAPGLQPGAYSICAAADPDDEISEADEDNNQSCIPFTVLAGEALRADLVIEKVTPVGPDQASLKVKVKIKNAGSVEAGPFRIMAFRRNPRQPLLLIECPLTEGQLAAGSPASCDDLKQREPLAPGASAELTGYFAYVIAGGASLIRTPIGPGDPNPPVNRSVDFMVDGCFPPIDGSPVYCVVEEVDELNNFKGATLKVR